MPRLKRSDMRNKKRRSVSKSFPRHGISANSLSSADPTGTIAEIKIFRTAQGLASSDGSAASDPMRPRKSVKAASAPEEPPQAAQRPGWAHCRR